MAVTLDDVRGSSNPLISYNYDLVIPTVPGGGNGDVLRLHLLNTNIPGFGVEVFESNHHGFVIKHPGKKSYPRVLTAEYEESNDLTVLNAIRGWHDLMVDPDTGIQAPAALYKVDMFLELLSNDKAIAGTVRLRGCFPEEVPDTPLDGATSDAVRISVNFSYDDHIRE